MLKIQIDEDWIESLIMSEDEDKIAMVLDMLERNDEELYYKIDRAIEDMIDMYLEGV